MATVLCICELCNCGRHRCPHKNNSSPIKAKCLLSEYRFAYEPAQYPPQQPKRESMRPKQKRHTPKVPFDEQSDYRENYIKHQGHERAKPYPPIMRNVLPVGKQVKESTTYMQDFAGPAGKRAVSYKPDSKYKKNVAKVPYRTMYQLSFRAVDPQKYETCRCLPIRHEENLRPSSAKVETTTVMKDDYKKHVNPEKAKSHKEKPAFNITKGEDKFDGDTTYMKEFPQKRPEPCYPMMPFEYRPNTAPFMGITTAKADYQPHYNNLPQPSYKPSVRYKPCDDKFAGESTTADSYQPWPAAVTRRDKPVWLAKKNTIEWPNHLNPYSTSYKEYYRDPPSDQARTMLLKPNDQEALFGAYNSDDTSNKYGASLYQMQYLPPKHNVQRTTFQFGQVYAPPNEPFDSQSVYQSSYTGKATEPAIPCKPGFGSDSISGGNRTTRFDTTYQDFYRGEEADVCPVSMLYQPPGEGGVEAYDIMGSSNGHEYILVRPNADGEGELETKAEHDPARQGKKHPSQGAERRVNDKVTKTAPVDKRLESVKGPGILKPPTPAFPEEPMPKVAGDKGKKVKVTGGSSKMAAHSNNKKVPRSAEKTRQISSAVQRKSTTPGKQTPSTSGRAASAKSSSAERKPRYTSKWHGEVTTSPLNYWFNNTYEMDNPHPNEGQRNRRPKVPTFGQKKSQRSQTD